MSRPARDRTDVDQIAFGPGSDGVVSESSSLSADDHRKWEQVLLPLVRLESYDQTLPDTSLSYFAFNGLGVAVLRRTNNGWSDGRNPARALVGRADGLTPLRALALETWPGWDVEVDRGQPMSRLDSGDLPGPEQSHQRLPRGGLTTMVAALLRDPEVSMTVVGADERARVPLMRGVLSVLGPVFEGSNAPRRWTFSTHEKSVDHHIKKAAEFIFLPSYLDGATMITGSLVRLDSPVPADDWAVRVAHHLVDTYSKGGANAVQEVLAYNGVHKKIELRTRIDALRGGIGAVEISTHKMPVSAPAGFTAPKNLKDRAIALVEQQPTRLSLVRELAAVTGAPQAGTVLRALDALGPVESVADRASVRKVLLTDDFAMHRIDSIGRHHPEVFEVVTRMCFGERLDDVRLTDPATLRQVFDLFGQHASSPKFFLALIEKASTVEGKTDLLLPVIGLRQLAERGLGDGAHKWPDMFCSDPRAHTSPAKHLVNVPQQAVPTTLREHVMASRVVLALIGIFLFLVGLALGVAQSASG